MMDSKVLAKRHWEVPAILRKALTILRLSPAVIPLLLVRLLRPVILVRFGPLTSSRIGDIAMVTEIYLTERDAGMHGPPAIDVFYHVPPISNYQLKKMWDRTIHVSRFAGLMDMLNRHLPGGQAHYIPRRFHQERDLSGLLAHTQPHLSFTDAEEEMGQNALEQFGVPKDTPFVCFHARDAAYLDSELPIRDWQYHNYRDCSISNYLPAVEELVKRGYWAIRVGSVVKEPLKSNNPKIIDYATQHRTDFLDIYLNAECCFYLGTDSGIFAIPAIFRRPIAYVNGYSLDVTHTWGDGNLFIPKKLWLREQERFLTFPEILNSKSARFYETDQYEEAGIEVLENTSEEIMAVAIEMDRRLKGTWETSQEDELLQQRFRSLFDGRDKHGVFLARIGAEFLRQNQDLLEPNSVGKAGRSPI